MNNHLQLQVLLALGRLELMGMLSSTNFIQEFFITHAGVVSFPKPLRCNPMVIMVVAHLQVLQHPQPHLQVNRSLLALMLTGCQIYIKLFLLFPRTPMERLFMAWMCTVCNNQIAASMYKGTVAPFRPNHPLGLLVLRLRTFQVTAICLMTSQLTMVQTI
jgi:hypothetical protein